MRAVDQSQVERPLGQIRQHLVRGADVEGDGVVRDAERLARRADPVLLGGIGVTASWTAPAAAKTMVLEPAPVSIVAMPGFDRPLEPLERGPGEPPSTRRLRRRAWPAGRSGGDSVSAPKLKSTLLEPCDGTLPGKDKGPLAGPVERKWAASYSPGRLPSEYHRR